MDCLHDRRSEADKWKDIEAYLGVGADNAEIYRRDFRGARTYVTEASVIKIQLDEKTHSHSRFFQSLRNEYRALKWVQGDDRFVQISRYVEGSDFSYMELVKIPGKQLSSVDFDWKVAFASIVRLFLIGVNLTSRRILHGDLNIHNFIKSPAGQITLIDFGLARKESLARCIWHNFFSRGVVGGQPTFPLSGTFIRIVEFSLPAAWRPGYRKILRIAPYNPHLPDMPQHLTGPNDF